MPEALPVLPTSNLYCRRLRCKEMFIDTKELFDIASTGSGIHWCGETQQVLGPDGQVAEPENCKTGRGCFEAL